MEGALHLSAPAPNPAAERATLSFAVQEGTKAEVTMYDVLGQRVRTLYEGRPPREEGRRLTVETRDLPSGVYVVRLRAGGRTQTRRLTVVQ
nr:T9SS type A sorting domain-containing protein [Salinibacter ruber]